MNQMDFSEAWQSLSAGYNRVLKHLDSVANGVYQKKMLVLYGRSSVAAP